MKNFENLTYKNSSKKKSEKPPCYGYYWDGTPTVRNLLERECLKIVEETESFRRHADCEYHTFDEDGCPVVSPTPLSLKKKNLTNFGENYGEN